MMVNTTRMWDSLVTGIDRPELAVDPRYATPEARAANSDQLHEEVAAWTRTRTKFEVMEHLAECGVPVSAVYNTQDIFEDKHLNARNAIRTVHHPVKGPLKMPAPPIRLSESNVEMQPAPLLGQHSAEVLGAELGLTDADLEHLAARGVVQLGRVPEPAAV